MKLTLVNVFRLVREEIANKKEYYICITIHSLVEGGSITYRDMQAAKNVIQGRMGGYASLDAWLEHKHGIPAIKLTKTRMREYRLRWLDSLIAEFS